MIYYHLDHDLLPLIGMEINISNKLSGGEGLPFNREEYLDIRDDRVMWFFDMYGHKTSYDFVVKLNAVTAGEFVLPPTLFEAMYNNKYKAVKKGKFVKVLPR